MTTFLQLQTEFFARGHDYLNDGGAGLVRAKSWINQAERRVAVAELWSFRLTTATGAAPLTIADLGKVLTVVDTANARTELTEVSEAEVTVGDVDLTGTPTFYYVGGGKVYAWPVGGTLSVRYYKLPPTLTADADVSMIPTAYADVVIDDAVRRAAKDRQFAEGVQLAAQEYEAGLVAMRDDLVAPTHIIRSHGSEDD